MKALSDSVGSLPKLMISRSLAGLGETVTEASLLSVIQADRVGE
jgi:hypothetical protein